MPKYSVIFRCTVTIDAQNADEAIKQAWLNENLKNATYKYLDVKRLPSEKITTA